MYKTMLAIEENKIKETKKGQKEDWTGKKGLKNVISLKKIHEVSNFL